MTRDGRCVREVELNRRFSPDVHLGVGALRRPDGAEEPVLVVDGDRDRLFHRSTVEETVALIPDATLVCAGGAVACGPDGPGDPPVLDWAGRATELS